MIAVLLVAAPAAAQQGSVQVVAGGVVTTGDPARTGGLDGYQSDLGFSWLRPTVGWGVWTIEAHGVRDDSAARFGRALFAVRDLKRGDTKWNISAGDTAYTPLLRDYAFTNLFAPQVTFRGASAEAANPRNAFSVTAGRVTVLRDLFAANAEVLGQTLVAARGRHKASGRLEFVAHLSSVRTENVREYSYDIKAGEDAGAGVRLNVTNQLQVIADAGVTSYVRKGETTREQKPTFLAGVRWTDKQGWLQVNGYQFAPGNFSVINNPYDDRRGLFAGGEYAFNRLRLYGGWDLFRRNLDPAAASYGAGLSSRAYAGVRFPINSHLFLGGRVEDGARTAKPSQYNVGYESDTGVRAIDWQVTFPKWTAIGRYEQRSNVDTQGSLAPTTFNQRDVAGQLFFNVTSSTRILARVMATDRRDLLGNGQSFWQASAGTEFQVTKRNLYGRAEVIVGRSRDFRSPFLMPHSALSAGLNAQVRNHVSLALDVYVDRSPVGASTINPWMSRTIARLVYTLPTGAPVSRLSSVARGAKAGSETIEGLVFVDWNSNGVQDPDEETLSGVRIELDSDLGATADKNGRFRFERIAAGPHRLAVDLNTVPADFDAPASPLLEFAVRRATLAKAAFGVLPLGDVEGSVVRDANGSGAVDENDEPLDGAVLVLDGGARTEITRKGRFRFTGVRIGTHTVEVLLESLPDGAALAGERSTEVQVARSQMTANASFLVKLEKRPEIRKTFAPKKPDPGKTDGKSGATVKSKSDGKGQQTTGTKAGSSGGSGSKGHRQRRPDSRGARPRH